MISDQAAQFGIAFRYLFFGSFIDPKPENPEKQGHAAIYFPVVGFIFGIGFMVSYYLVSRIANAQWSCFLVMGLMIWIFNGRMYFDCMGFVDAWNLRPGLEKDVVRGLLVFTLFTLKFLALTHLGEGWILRMLVLTPTLSCWSLVYLTHSISSNLSNTKNRLVYASFVQVREFWGATLFTTLIAGTFMELEGLFLLMFMSIWIAIFERWVLLEKKFPLKHLAGTVMELNEILVLLGAIALRKGFIFSASKGAWI